MPDSDRANAISNDIWTERSQRLGDRSIFIVAYQAAGKKRTFDWFDNAVAAEAAAETLPGAVVKKACG